MAQKLFQSIRKLPGQFSVFRKKTETSDVHGIKFKLNNCADYGFPPKPTSLAYDPVIDMLAVLTREGSLYLYGKPGIVYHVSHDAVADFIQVYFLTGSRKLITLTDSNSIYLWELVSIGQSAQLIKKSCLNSVTKGLRYISKNNPTSGDVHNLESHITAVCCCANNSSIFIGTDDGWIASIRITGEKSGQLTVPNSDDSISPDRILSCFPDDRRQRFRTDAVVVLSERPGFPGQLLIGYSSGLSFIFDLRCDRVVAVMQWQHGLETATWCGGSGLPSKSPNFKDPLPDLGTRLLTAYSDGSLGVWSLKDVKFGTSTSTPSNPPVLTMEEAPSMPYGPFPCKLISKVFWLPSSFGGITIFVGGMPRATYGERHTVSVLRGSNIDRAAEESFASIRLAVAVDAEDDDELPELPNNVAPIHVFDSDAPEHVCFDLSSSLIDITPVGPIGGPTQMLLVLCEEEIVAIDLVTEGWPFMRPPYLTCLHTTPLTTFNLITQVNPTFMLCLEAAGAYYGPEGRFGRANVISNSLTGGGWSTLPWPIQGGQALIHGSRLSASSLGGSALFTNDLLLTGHEDGSVGFWRLSAGGGLRRIYTLHTSALFDSDAVGFNNVNGAHEDGDDDDDDAWPPFRLAGLFDPFMDDSRLAVQLIRLIDNTLVIGGAAGQVTVWQMLDFVPPLQSTPIAIKTEMPGFQWKGHAPLSLRSCCKTGQLLKSEEANRKPPAQLQATGVILIQPPARITALQLTQLNSNQSSDLASGQHVLLAIGTPHGFGVTFVAKPHLPPGLSSESITELSAWKALAPRSLLAVSTIPDNLDALQEAFVGEGWARRRTRELKKSLRHSFRRIKRMRSTRASQAATTAKPMVAISRAGIRRTVTQSNPISTNQSSAAPLDEAERRVTGRSDTSQFMPSNMEREICDRTPDSANVAIVSCFTFGPPMFRISPQVAKHTPVSIGSLFVGTKAGTVKVYSIFADRHDLGSSMDVAKFQLQYSKELILQHGAPVLALRLIDAKVNTPLSVSSFNHSAVDVTKAPTFPSLVVVSEEQVRIFNLPNLHLRHKIRITATDGFRIKTASLVGFRVPKSSSKTGGKDADSINADLDKSTVSNNSSASQLDCSSMDYSLVFTNVGGQSVVLHLPQLKRLDTLAMMDASDVVAVSSVQFSESGCSDLTSAGYVNGPALGFYQTASGQLSLFDFVRTGQKASLLGMSYRAVYRLPAGSPNRCPTTASMPPIAGLVHPQHVKQTNIINGSHIESPANVSSSTSGSQLGNSGLYSPVNSSTSSRFANLRNRLS